MKITWKAAMDDPMDVVRGKTFSGGYPEEVNGEMAVRFQSPRIGGKQVVARISTRPELAAKVAEFIAARESERDAREARLAAEKAAQDAADKPLLDAMRVEVGGLRGLIPAGSVEVSVVESGSFDGWPILDYYADGTKLSGSDIVIHGHAAAIRPGASGAFASVTVASISRERLAKIIADRDDAEARGKAESEKAVADREAKFAEAATTGKPVELRRWTENRRAQEGGEWGDYLFICREFAMPDGSTKIEAENTY